MGESQPVFQLYSVVASGLEHTPDLFEALNDDDAVRVMGRIVGWLGWLAGRILQAAVSRQREFLADADAIQFTRTRDGLGNVLRKIWSDQNELADRRTRARQITALLKDEEGRWGLVREEIEEIQKTYGGKDDRRRTLIEAEDEVEFTADDFIVEEDNVVIVSRDGWVKRQKDVKDLAATRLREGDSVLAAFAGSTRATCVFFSNFGAAYTCRFIEIRIWWRIN